jgi:hypothetical protein
MLAAGHPPLPEMEIETFLQAMPPHWTPLAMKGDAIKKLMNYNPNEPSRTKSLAIGALTALREAVALLAAKATSPQAKNLWPDLADFDCYGCHHDLASPSWRQEKGYRGVAGRPEFRSWPEALVKGALFLVSSDEAAYRSLRRALRERMDRLHSAANARPFGEPERIGNPSARGSASGELLIWFDGLIADLERKPLRRDATIRLLQKLSQSREPGDPPADAILGIDAARQVAWAITALYDELQPRPARDREIQGIFQEMKNVLSLDLPPKIEAASRYDPAWFRRKMDELAVALR